MRRPAVPPQQEQHNQIDGHKQECEIVERVEAGGCTCDVECQIDPAACRTLSPFECRPQTD